MECCQWDNNNNNQNVCVFMIMIFWIHKKQIIEFEMALDYFHHHLNKNKFREIK